MWWTIAFDVVKALLVSWVAGWRAEHEKKAEIENAVAPYKAEAEALGAPAHSKHDDIVRLRNDDNY